MVMLDASRRGLRVPPLAAWSLGVGIVATVGADLAHGLGHGPIGALVSVWSAVALIGSFELLMMLVRSAPLGVPAWTTRCPRSWCLSLYRSWSRMYDLWSGRSSPGARGS
jgi:hypothetical protein